MKTLTKTALALAIVPFLATASLAGNGNGKGKGHGHWKGYSKHQSVVVKGCPPGLAKKNPPCIPPGHAKPKIGDSIEHYDYVRITDFDRYRLDPDYRYYRVGELIYRTDPETFKILEVIGLMDELLN